MIYLRTWLDWFCLAVHQIHILVNFKLSVARCHTATLGQVLTSSLCFLRSPAESILSLRWLTSNQSFVLYTTLLACGCRKADSLKLIFQSGNVLVSVKSA